MKPILIILFFSLLLLPGACSAVREGRSIAGQIEGGRIIPDSASRIYISILLGRGVPPEFSEELMLSLKTAISLDGRLTPVASEGESDRGLLLRPVLYGDQGILFDSAGRVVKRRIWLTVSVTLADRPSGKIIIRDKDADLSVEFDPDITEITEAYRLLAERTSAAVLSIIHTGWAGKGPGAGKEVP